LDLSESAKRAWAEIPSERLRRDYDVHVRHNEGTERKKTAQSSFLSCCTRLCCEILPATRIPSAYLKERGAEMVMKKLKFLDPSAFFAWRKRLRRGVFHLRDALRV
jgi:hypothetical protein